MECKDEIIVVCGRWDGLYEWGKCFLSHEKAVLWNSYWGNFQKIKEDKNWVFWKCYIDKKYNTPYLFSSSGSIFVHPMNFTTFLHFDGVNSSEYEIRELKEICDSIADFCGCEFHMTIEKKTLYHDLCISSMNDKDKNFEILS